MFISCLSFSYLWKLLFIYHTTSQIPLLFVFMSLFMVVIIYPHPLCLYRQGVVLQVASPSSVFLHCKFLDFLSRREVASLKPSVKLLRRGRPLWPPPPPPREKDTGAMCVVVYSYLPIYLHHWLSSTSFSSKNIISVIWTQADPCDVDQGVINLKNVRWHESEFRKFFDLKLVCSFWGWSMT